MNGAETLLEDYNAYRFRTHNIQQLRQRGQYVQSLGPKRISAFQELYQWCVERSIDPRRWLCSLFEARRWLFAPPLNQLKSKKHLDRYSKITDLPAFQTRLAQERTKRRHIEQKTFDPNRDLTASAESLKSRYLEMGNLDRCMEQMDTETYGFHPKSSVCSRCPVQNQCAAMLRGKVRFDIMALRCGEITADQAKAIVYHGRRQ